MGTLQLLRFARKTSPAQDSPAPAGDRAAQAPRSPIAIEPIMRDLALQATGLAREAAEIRGSVEDVAAVARAEVDAFERLGGEIGEMIDANAAIAASVAASKLSAQAAHAAVERVAADVTGALDSLRAVAEVADEITRIALQTRLVAFNAAVEAKHAGEAGRGFAVVAEAVKDLSQKVEASSKTIGRTVLQLDQRIGELARNIRESGVLGDGQPTFHRAFGDVVDATAAIGAATERNQEKCGATRASLDDLQRQVDGTRRALEDARNRTESFLSASEFLIQMSADCGASTADSPFIDKVVAAAAEVSQLFERAVADGAISLEDLFDTDYRPVSGTQPQQHMTKFVALTDRVLPPIQEAMLSFSDKVVFCAAVDRNGYLPTHNRKFSKTPGADPVWNAANCRNRRIFNDRTGLAAGQNQHRFLLQTYRRDMGGGTYKLMKDISAPIQVQGRHWGGLRIGYAY
ncbi:MAG TPA: methyl-accepting chemotaxis protein [Burkholderiaceae bacterium]|nr:methyl-accepting chemotaxis protein [Burkholderiaceae bacterium]